MRTFLAISLLLAFGASALAEDAPPAGTPAPTGTPTTADAKDPLDQVVCRSLPAPTGTRLGGRKICKTQREWNDLQKGSQDVLKNMQTKGLGYGGPSN